MHFLITFQIGFVLGIWGYFANKTKCQYLHLPEKEEENESRRSRFLKEDSELKVITLSGKSSKNSLSLFPPELLYIESTGNYVHVYYTPDQKTVMDRNIRTTLSKMEEALKDYPFIVRCHRAFIVNLRYVKKINGSKIRLNTRETEIPISKTYKANVYKRISSIDRLSQIQILYHNT